MFWDSSAIVPTLLVTAHSREVMVLLSSDPRPAIWWSTPVECESALFRRDRERPLPSEAVERALGRLAALIEDVYVIAPTPALRERAGRLLRGHPLRAGDALQLAAALAWTEDAPRGEAFVCLDSRLREAASRQGFAILPA
jgi:predicted nucleic acid-binding protein